jgi:uncharacterized LabA/DUF88 family protein
MAKTRVYIDGFNLYHGIIRDNRLHWLDLEAFARRLNRTQDVDRVLYFTAMVSSFPGDPYKAQRQDAYHRALQIACPKLEIVKGTFSRQKKAYPIAGCPNAPTCVVRVAVRTEKGSDVNLASRLLHDAHIGTFDRAIVVSGDSDLAETIRLVTQEVKKTVWVRNPRDVASAELTAVASDYDRIRPKVLIDTQLPNEVTDGIRTYRKPPKWSQPVKALTKQIITTTSCQQAGCTNTFKTFRFE